VQAHSFSGAPARTVGIGIVGLGTAGRSLLPAIAAHPHVRLAAVADSLHEAREGVATRFAAASCADIEALVARADVDAVYIATPTELHAQHVEIAATAGKAVLVEKPMAIDCSEALRMINVAERNGVVLLVGHSHSYDTPYQAMRDIVAGGSLGSVRMMHNIYYTDWMYRPRRTEELDSVLGGGVTNRQGAHQFDILRLIGGGLVKTVRATTFDWDPRRPGTGAHTAFLTFVDGTVATAVYNGYGGFLSSEICCDIAELGDTQRSVPGASRDAFYAQSGDDEMTAKRQRAATEPSGRAAHQPFFGWTIVSCEGGDIRQSPDGLYVYSERGRIEVPLTFELGTRDRVLIEFYESIVGDRAPLHDGRWGLANLEVAIAAQTSSRTSSEITLEYQIAVRDDARTLRGPGGELR